MDNVMAVVSDQKTIIIVVVVVTIISLIITNNKNIHLYTANYRKTRTGAVYKLKWRIE